jgi:hypothetical protein
MSLSHETVWVLSWLFTVKCSCCRSKSPWPQYSVWRYNSPFSLWKYLSQLWILCAKTSMQSFGNNKCHSYWNPAVHQQFTCFFSFFTVAQQPSSDLVVLVCEVSRSHTIRHTPGRTPLNLWSSRHRNPYILIKQRKQQTNIMPSSRYDPAIPAIKVTRTYSLDRKVTGSSWHSSQCTIFSCTV